MRTKLLIALCLFMPAIVPVFAQKTATISIGGGTTIPSGNIKDSAHIRPMQAINLQAYLPVVKRTKYSIGLQAGVSYGWGNQKQITTLPAGYPALNGSQNNLSLLDNGNPKNRLYQLEAGIAASISLGRLNILPGLVGGYVRLEQKKILASQAGVYGIYGGSYVYSFTQEEETTHGLCLMPRLKLMYQPDNFGVWIEGGYTYGPDIINEATRSASSISTVGSTRSSYTAQTRTKYKATTISLGITLGIGRHTCLICGGKHRGKCKYGYADDIATSMRISPVECVGYLCNVANPEDCSCKSGICCLPEVIVSPKFNMLVFDKLVSAKKYNKLKKLLNVNAETIGLENFANLPSGKKIIDAIIKGEIVFVKGKKNLEQYNYFLQDVTSKKEIYIAHVTFLCKKSGKKE